MISIFLAVRNYGKIFVLSPYAKSTVKMIYIFFNDEKNLNKTIIKYCLQIIGHFCEFYGQNVKLLLNVELLCKIVEFKKNIENEDEEYVYWVQNEIQEALLIYF